MAKFLHILAHNVRNRTMSFFFHCSGGTITGHFHNVLRVVISLEHEFLVQPSGAEVPPQLFHNNRYYPYFKVSSIFDYTFNYFYKTYTYICVFFYSIYMKILKL